MIKTLADIPDHLIHRWMVKFKPSKNRTSAENFVKQFGAQALESILMDEKGNAINFEWIVAQMLIVFYDRETTSQTKLLILKELKEMIKMGAIQQEDLQEHLGKLESSVEKVKREASPDPFVLPKLVKKVS